ncbi:hypothetical protein NECAME_09904, partial [Necator americanus]
MSWPPNSRHLLLLLLLIAAERAVFARRDLRRQIPFVFTAKLYNVSLEENAPGTEFARSSDHVPIGVPLPHSDATVKFKIVEGDRQHHFKAHSRQVGDFVFLRIRQKDRMDTPLNRELKVPGRLIPQQTNVTISAGQEHPSSGMVNTTANIKIEVGQPHSIVFEDAMLSFNVNESSPVGYVIGRVSASAMYKMDERNIRYYLEMRENFTVPFEVSEKSGIIRLSQELDYEAQREYSF